MIQEILIDDIGVLIHSLNELPNNYIYRGHSNSAWRLESNLERMLGANWGRELAQKTENYSLDVFQSKFHIYNNSEKQPYSKLAWLAMMQHYGVPTRLLDFTTSPYIALYFALENYNPENNQNLSVHALDYRAINQVGIDYIKKKDSSFLYDRVSAAKEQDKVFDETIDRFSYDIIWITEPKELNIRLDRQSGCFLIAGNRGEKIEDLVNSSIYSHCSCKKMVISNKLYENIYALLRKMNINSKYIYGDLQGFAKSLRMELTVYCHQIKA